MELSSWETFGLHHAVLRGCARSSFPGEVPFRMSPFILLLFPVRIFLERATAPSFSSRSSHFCLSAREALFHHRFFFKTFFQVQTRASSIPKRIVCFLVSNIVCSHSRVAPSDLPSHSPARIPALDSCYRQFVLQCTCTIPFVFPVSPSSVLFRGLSFRTPQFETDLVFDRYGSLLVASKISHGFR